VAEANAEAIASLPPGGTAVVPQRASALVPYLGRDDITIRRFDPNDVERRNGTTRFSLDGQSVSLALPFTQRHHAVNVLAALHAYAALGLPLDRAWEGADAIQLSPWRGEETSLPGGGLVINDAYNANPDSMRAALEHLAERAGDRRSVAILGGMAELGAESDRYHREIGELAVRLGVEVIAVGELARAYGPVGWVTTPEDAVEVARTTVKPGDVVLVKGSRAVGLEGIAAEIANFARA
jgi:UDP-N-acetylmuramoyl-tripeptide--D-alanyl-D-alanine ligase